jgi:hypothetical protein
MFIKNTRAFSRVIFVTCGVFLVLVVGWKMFSVSDPVIDLSSKPCSLVVYTNGAPSMTVALAPDSSLGLLVDKVLISKRNTWKRSLVSFAPVILVRSEAFSVDFQESRVVVNFKDDSGSWSQVVSDLTNDEWVELEKEVADCRTKNDKR